jgi:hypothetical protein
MAPAASVSAEKRLGVMEVAHRLKVRYQKARDLMLTGKLGDTSYESGHLQITESGIAIYEAARKKRRAQ